jgi:beta-lactamase regulating signal transducer with metallopeptidase domain
MSISANELAWNILHNTLWITIAALVVSQLVSWLKPRSPQLQRLGWFLVLIPGICLLDWRIPVPITTQLKTIATATENASELIDQSERGQAESFDSVDNAQFSSDANSSDTENSVPQQSESLRSNSAEFRLTTSPGQASLENSPQSEEATSPQLDVETASGVRDILARDSSNQPNFASNVRPFVAVGMPQINWSALFVIFWLAGGGFVVLKGLLQLVAFQISLRDCQPARKHWNRQWRSLLASQKIERTILLLEHNNHGPMLTITPRGLAVVVPSDYWEELTTDQRFGVLRHELAHYQRGDIFSSLLANVLVLLQWFNPVAWYALRRFDECAEWSCDEQLIRDTPVQVTDYAKALITLIEFPHACPIASQAAKGSSIATRIHRLVIQNVKEDSKMKNLLIAFSLTVLFATGLFRIELVAQGPGELEANSLDSTEAYASSSPEPASSTDDVANTDDTEQRIEELGKKVNLANDSEKLLERFATALRTEAGKIVISDRAANYEGYLREQAESDSTPAFLSDHFEKLGDKYTLKKGLESYVEEFQQGCRTFEQDTAAMAAVLKDYGNRMATDNESNQLIKRYLLDENTAAQLYIEEVQDTVRPDYRVVRQRLSELFVIDRNNQLVLRAGAKGRAEQLAKNLEKANRMAERLNRELSVWRMDLSESEATAKSVRQAMSDPLNGCFIAVDSMNEDYTLDERVENYFEYMENLFIDKADGLVPAEDRAAEVKQGLNEFASVKQAVTKIEPHLLTLASQLKAEDAVCKRWKQLLASNIAAAWIVNERGTTASEPDVALKNWLDEWFETSDDGKLTVKTDRQEELVNRIRESLRNGRALRRRGLDVAEFGRKLDNASLAAAYQTLAGKCMVMRSVQDKVSQQYYDGLGAWIAEHFDSSDDGYTLKEGHEYEINNFLESTDAMTKELANDDF